jgi:hypothetical protein
MNRLPGYDGSTSRAELAAFSSLGLIGAALITGAVCDAVKFARDRDCIVGTLSAPLGVKPVCPYANSTRNATNLTRAHLAPATDLHVPTPASPPNTQGQPL